MVYEDKLKSYLLEPSNKFTFDNPEILINVIEELQKVIKYAMVIEQVDPMLIPKLILGEESEDIESDKTNTYEKPVLSVTLNKRMTCGTNEKTLTKLFDNNLIAGAPKFTRKVKDENDENLYEQGVFFTDNELALTLKTKTVKEQLKIINILERALNIYARELVKGFIVVCGIKEIKTDDKKDNKKFETAKVMFQMRLKEVVNVNNLALIKGFKIFTSDENIIDVYSGKLDKDGKWIDNVQGTDYGIFV